MRQENVSYERLESIVKMAMPARSLEIEYLRWRIVSRWSIVCGDFLKNAVIETKWSVNVTKEFNRGAARVMALQGLNLEIVPGEFMLIVGPSGCGKTTLISLIADTPYCRTGRSNSGTK